ncbi:MAG: GNAT family N-acetyltransferase [Betaproteobacteria bacterium]|nr:GNAT family N-acetyltransferase [Betaproteobacteria bacterium]
MHIRRLGADDAAAYHAFRLDALRRHPEAFRSDAADEAAKPASWAVARLLPSADNPHGFALGAFDADGRMAGTVVLETTARLKLRHRADVLGMVVAPALAGQGVGGLLLQRLVAQARQVPHLELLHLTVTHGNARAIALYERHGFVRDGVERAVMKIGAQYHDKQHMTLALWSGA